MIREQIEDAEATVAREVAEFDARFPVDVSLSETPRRSSNEEATEDKRPSSHSPEKQQQNGSSHEKPVVEPETPSNEPQNPGPEALEVMGADSAQGQRSESASKPDETPINGSAPVHDPIDVHRGAEDDGGEMVENKEDTVIY